MGTTELLRFMLRRDRVRLPAWVLGISVFVPYFFTAFRTIFPTREDLLTAASFVQGPVVTVLGGPGYGLGEGITHHAFFAGVYLLYFLVAAGFMNILLVSRHTRVEEQTGRAELVRANVVGPLAPLTAAVLVALVADAALAGTLTLALLGYGTPVGEALLLGCAVGAFGLVLAGVTATTVQLSGYSRVSSALAGAVLGASFVVRAAGDSLGEHGSALSWLSPFAWSQQTRVFVDGRWWPLGLSVLAAAATTALGYALARRRDLGAGLWAARRGPAHAPAWLRTPAALAWRLHRSGLRGWTVGLVLAGLVYGGTTQALVDAFADMNDLLAAVLGGEEDPVGGYLALMASLMIIATAIFVVLAVQRTRAEELEGRAAPVLATATSKAGWLTGHTVVVALAALVLLAAGSLATGVGAAAVTRDVGHVATLLVGGLVGYPAVLVVLGLATLLYGARPRALTLAWVIVVVGGVVEFFGPLLDPPAWLANLSPWEHTPGYPVEDVPFAPLAVQAALALAAGAAGLALFQRRDLTAT
ncbi:ABC transporter permease [Georgenia wangjunii]|uniref:ABC transporter permease n=1 Tax=Georgenia wangjunii TaxID=3117730 RepID=UPI002F266566